MKVLIYGEYFLPSVGGVQTAVELLARGLATYSGTATELRLIKVTVATNTPRGTMDDRNLPYRVTRNPSLRQLWNLIREADVLHLAGPCLLPMLLGWANRKPVIVVHHVYQAICPNGLLFKQPSQTVCKGHFAGQEYSECFRCCGATMGAARAAYSIVLGFPRRWLCDRAIANVAVTDHVANRLKMPRSRTIYLGIDDTKQAGWSEVSDPRGIFEFGYIGRLVAEKGLPLLLQAARHLADEQRPFHVTFIGDGPERQRLEVLVKEMRLVQHVSFVGELTGVELQRASRNIAALVMPSIWEETAGLAAIEQMMRGRLVIASDIGGLGEIVDGAGLKFNAGDPQGLAQQMRRVIDDRSLVTTMGSSARTRAKEFFHSDVMISRHVEACRRSISSDKELQGT